MMKSADLESMQKNDSLRQVRVGSVGNQHPDNQGRQKPATEKRHRDHSPADAGEAKDLGPGSELDAIPPDANRKPIPPDASVPKKTH
jgi:hypothetical protein